MILLLRRRVTVSVAGMAMRDVLDGGKVPSFDQRDFE
jgi:hypothetical protein